MVCVIKRLLMQVHVHILIIVIKRLLMQVMLCRTHYHETQMIVQSAQIFTPMMLRSHVEQDMIISEDLKQPGKKMEEPQSLIVLVIAHSMLLDLKNLQSVKKLCISLWVLIPIILKALH